MGDMNMPFERNPPGTEITDDFIVSSGVVVMGSVVDVPNVGPMASVVLRFADARGSFYTPVLLVMQDEDLDALPGLVSDAVKAALELAREKRRR